MMNLVLQREVLGDKSTVGRLIAENDEFLSFTLEDVVRVSGPKVYGKTAIPIGKFRVVVNESQRFKRRLPLLLDVPGFTGIRIHAGNTSEDTEGCILIGLTKSDNFIGKSQMAMSLFLPKLEAALQDGGEVWIDVRNPETGTPVTMSKAE